MKLPGTARNRRSVRRKTQTHVREPRANNYVSMDNHQLQYKLAHILLLQKTFYHHPNAAMYMVGWWQKTVSDHPNSQMNGHERSFTTI